MIKERRKHPRLRIPLEAEYLVAGEEEWRQGTIWTLGAGGAALLSECKLARGNVLEGVHFVVAAEGELPETRIEVGAEVVNCDHSADFGRLSSYMLGLQFRGLGEQEFELLKQFVFRRLINSRPAADDGAEDPKAAAAPIEIRFKLFDEFVEEVSENLSPTGMFIRAHRPLPPGSRFVFQFQLGEDFSLFQGTAEVVWTRRRGEGPDRPSGMGVRFIKLDLTSQRMVNRLIGEHAVVEPEDATGDVPRPAADVGPVLAVSGSAEPFAIAGEGRATKEAKAESDTVAPRRQTKRVAAAEANLSRRLARLETRLEELQSARDEAEERAARLDGESAELRQETRDLKSSLAAAEAARSRAETEAGELQREFETLRPDDDVEEKLLRSREELAERQQEWEKLEAELRTEIGRGAVAEAELRESLELTGSTEAELHQRLDRAAETEAELRQEVERAAETEAELRQGLEQAGETEAKLQQQLEGAAETEAGLRQELEQAAETEAGLRQELEQAAETEAGLQRQLEGAGETEAELRARLERAEAAQAELEGQTERADDAESRLDRMRQELAESRGEWEAIEAELRAQLERDRAAAAALDQRLSDAVDVEAELRQRLSEVRGARETLEERVARGAEVEAALREQAQELRAAVDLREAKLARADGRLARLRDAAEQMKSRFNGDLSAARELGSDLEETLAQVAQFGAGLDESVGRLTAARSALADRLSRIDEAWSGLEGGLQELAPDEAEPESAVDDDLSVMAPATSGLEQISTLEGPESGDEGAEVVADELGSEAAPNEVKSPAMSPMEEALEAPEAPAAEQVEPPAALEATDDEASDEAVTPAPKSASRLVGAARRAVARLGFARRPAADSEPAAPSLLEAGTEPVEGPDEAPAPKAIEETVKAWAVAWSERRVEDYLSFYSREFEAARADDDEDTGESPHAWLPPLAGMALTLGPISQTEMAPGRFAVQFEQSVESDTYTRRTGRTLEMVLEADAWKIAAESFQDLPH